MSAEVIKEKIPIPNYTKGEEIFNMVSHIVGGAFGLAVTALCVIMAAVHGNVYGVVSAAIFGSTMIILYSMSSIYHGLSPSLKAKKVFRVLDHCTIFFLIAGTYTPLALCTLRQYSTALGWTYFGAVWGLAALGVTFTAVNLNKYKVLGMILYIAIGWCIAPVLGIVSAEIGTGGILFLVLGGISYTIGAVLYGIGKKKKYMHSVFHIFIVIGSLMHFFCILFYVL
ncbi:MAG: hemolysin III family protein [Clostridia bacterium]|nr:hemolysin III family protein [Clostridia bacterium]